MDTDQFWQLIETGRDSVATLTDLPAWLVAYLRQQTVEEMRDFNDRIFELDQAAYDERLWVAATLIMGMCSDDTFVDFRNWLIAKGREVYEAAMENPDTLADVDTSDGDGGSASLFYMSGVADVAYRLKLGDDMAELPSDLERQPLRNQDFWDGDKAKLQLLFPKLWANYNRDDPESD